MVPQQAEEETAAAAAAAVWSWHLQRQQQQQQIQLQTSQQPAMQAEPNQFQAQMALQQSSLQAAFDFDCGRAAASKSDGRGGAFVEQQQRRLLHTVLPCLPSTCSSHVENAASMEECLFNTLDYCLDIYPNFKIPPPPPSAPFSDSPSHYPIQSNHYHHQQFPSQSAFQLPTSFLTQSMSSSSQHTSQWNPSSSSHLFPLSPITAVSNSIEASPIASSLISPYDSPLFLTTPTQSVTPTTPPQAEYESPISSTASIDPISSSQKSLALLSLSILGLEMEAKGLITPSTFPRIEKGGGYRQGEQGQIYEHESAARLAVGESIDTSGTTACDFCRKRKVKCNRQRPNCSFCTKHGVECTTQDALKKRGPPTKAQRIEIKRAGLEYDRRKRRWCRA